VDNGSAPTFESLVERLSMEIYSYLWRMLRHTADAEDCLQETFLRAFRAYPRLRVDSNPRAWLYKIATNTAKTSLARRSRREASTGDLQEWGAEQHDDSAEVGERSQLLATLMSLVQALPHKQRAALLLRKYQGLRYAEVAEIIHSTEEAARANVYQALKRLRAEWRRQEERYAPG